MIQCREVLYVEDNSDRIVKFRDSADFNMPDFDMVPATNVKSQNKSDVIIYKNPYPIGYVHIDVLSTGYANPNLLSY